ncbi:integrin alpha-D isoform X2 [Oryzias melastigma]|uniref:integrin alpha-D isoform X2 n=1 Tax=Oryzias melastigma TaxID=30732 RepID=UPI00168D6878|nr:integrin alpha-D isoform X2 [Oryzias melastigma]
MRGICLICCIWAAAAVIPSSLAFNIGTTDVKVLSGEKKDFFGYKVFQFTSADKTGIIVTAPLSLNGSGEICKYRHEEKPRCQTSQDFPDANSTKIKHLGMSIAAKPTGSEFTVCSPNVVHECLGNSYLNSWCLSMKDNVSRSFKPGFQECTKNKVDLVFLFDGSGSMTEEEFKKNKDFIKSIMDSLSNTTIKFAAVQFSRRPRIVFDFNDHVAGRALEKLIKEEHMKSLTNTYRALQFILDNLFGKESAGATPGATQVLVLITDGDPSDTQKDGVLTKYDQKNIIRFVIGVKIDSMEKIKPIASEPKDKNVFKIEDYKGLDGILKNFQNKIFVVEGSKVALAGNLTNEMSQTGFSAAYYKDTLVLGSVGSNSWRGSLEQRENEDEEQHEDQILDPDMEMDSYMGFSLSTGERNGVPLYFSGAPRFQHTGQVVIFSSTGKHWTVQQRLEGTKVGSYFGAEICTVDIDSDDSTDFLLVGAPMFYQPLQKTEGKVYVYALTNKQLEMRLSLTAPSMGRFGTTISSLADMNGDGLRDVAVGAPLEDDNHGAVYIYLGDRNSGIRHTFSQRINGKSFQPEMRFFGLAVDGHGDLGNDGLPDVVVGSQGAAVVLRSKPVYNVAANLSFHPEVISIENIDCVNNPHEVLPMVNLTTCFQLQETTKSKTEKANLTLGILYTLSVDLMRQTHRGFFSPTDKKTKSLHIHYNLTTQATCFNHSVFMPKCVKDTLSPISIKFNFSQPDNENAIAVLNTDCKKEAIFEIPFEKKCRKNDTCVAELEVDFDFTTPTLLVSEQSYFNISILLANKGDDSYNTSLTVLHSPGLSFSNVNVTKATRQTLYECYDLKEVRDRTQCGISRPVYRSGSMATFHSSFHVIKDIDWNDTMTMTVFGQSDNTNSSRIGSVTKTIKVQYEIRMVTAVKEDSVTYLNFTTGDNKPQKMVITYQIDNTGFKDFPVNVSLYFPKQVQENFELINYQVFVQKNKTQCSSTLDKKSEDCTQEKECIVTQCNSFSLKKHSSAAFTLQADVHFRDIHRYVKEFSPFTGGRTEIRFKSLIRVDTDRSRYVLASYNEKSSNIKLLKNGQVTENDQTTKWVQKHPNGHREYREQLFTTCILCPKQSEVRVEIIVPPNQWVIIGTGAGAGLLLLIIITIILYKLGCFKRKKMPVDEEEVTFSCPVEQATNGLTDETVGKSDDGDKSDQVLEEQQSLQKSNGDLQSEDEPKDQDSA